MARQRRAVEFAVMSLLALVVAHDLAFLVAHGSGYSEALARSGHGDKWQTAVGVTVFAGVGLLCLAVWRLHRLGLIARRISLSDPPSSRALPGLWGEVAGLWSRLTVATMVAFAIQENVEHLQIDEPLPGLTVLGSAEYPNAVLVIAGVALAVAFVGALLRWRHNVLIAWIQAARAPAHPRPEASAARSPLDRDRRPTSFVGRSLAVRAPPVLPAL
jgi:hypothetical protein